MIGTKTFRTPLSIPASTCKIKHEQQILGLGSCFAENVGEQLMAHKFNAHLNPFGILYNPISIAQSLEILFNKTTFTRKDLFEHQGLWHSFQHHGRFSHLKQEEVLSNINTEIERGHKTLENLDTLILTFGSAHAFHHLPTNQIVANCHKLPTQEFQRKLLSVEEITTTYDALLSKLQAKRSDLQVILTVSPVRYLRDGLVESNRSKATLLLAVHKLQEKFSFVDYFPAYEIVTDELRDYRFFKEDMVHPTLVAVDYVWECFAETYFNQETLQLNKKIKQIQKNLAHRPIRPDSEAHKNFLKKQQILMEELSKEFPALNFSKEIQALKKADS